MTLEELLELASQTYAKGWKPCRGIFHRAHKKECCPLTAAAIATGKVSLAGNLSDNVIEWSEGLFGEPYCDKFMLAVDALHKTITCVSDETYNSQGFQHGLAARKKFFGD